MQNITLGRKVAMTQYFDDEGGAHAATIVEAGPNTVAYIRTKDKDGYDAVAVGFGNRKEKKIAKAQKGQWGDNNFSDVVEFRLDTPTEGLEVGAQFNVDQLFEAGDVIHVSGTSKGKGFQGVVKRYGFAGGRRTHGQKHSEREPGSIGATGPARVFKGTRMGGRMGGERVTVKNLEVLKVDKDTNTLLVKGAVPGRRGTLLEIVKLTY